MTMTFWKLDPWPMLMTYTLFNCSLEKYPKTSQHCLSYSDQFLVAASAFDDYLKKNNNFQLQISPSVDGKTARTCIFQCYIGGRPLLSGFLRKIALPIPGTWVFVLVQKAECIRIRFCFEFSNSLFLLEKMVES